MGEYEKLEQQKKCTPAMNYSKRIFVAAWEYPPIMSGESVVCRKTLEHSMHNYDVCCGPVDAQGDNHIRLYPVGGNKYLRWPFQVLRQFKKLDEKEHYRVMMSRVMPPNGHLAGWLIKRVRPDIKWVVYFSDPIWNSPFLKFSLWKSKDHRPNWLLMKVFGIPAKWAVRESDLLVFNNERLAKYVLGKRYDRYKDKVVIAPYGHEGVHPRPAPKRGDGKFRLTHVGQIYGNRTFANLVAGVELLQEREPKLFEQLDVRQVGFVCDAERKRIEDSPARSAFTLVDQVPYEQSIKEMYDADCLLVIDPVFDDPRKNIYVPGKIYDYMSTGLPILCIAYENSATGDIAKQAGMKICNPTFDKIFNSLQERRSDKERIDERCYSRFLCDIGVGKIDRKICEVVRDGE